MPRLAVTRFWFEGNAFCPRPTTLEDFRRREWSSGDDALSAAAGSETELAAVTRFIATHPEWTVTVLRCASANPGGAIVLPLFRDIVRELEDGLAGQRYDAVYLSLHGAAITEAPGNPESEIVRAVRRVLGTATFVGASFDLHGNPDPAIAGLLDFASAYRTYPHVDMAATAARVLDRIAIGVASGRRPVGAIVPAGTLLPSFRMATAEAPMRDLLEEARSLERPPVLDASVFGGFPYADTPTTGAAAMAWTDGDRPLALATAARCAASIVRHAPGFRFVRLPPAAALARAIAALEREPGRPVAVTEPADNPLSGGIGDTPGLLAAVLAIAPAVPVVVAAFVDPALVDLARRSGAGARLQCSLGARVSGQFGAAVPLRAQVARFTEGRYRNEGPMEAGLSVDCGASVVLVAGSVSVIVVTHGGVANDPAFFRLHGFDPDAPCVLAVKAKNHFRAAFDRRCSLIVESDTPGPAAADLSKLPFRNIPPAWVEAWA